MSSCTACSRVTPGFSRPIRCTSRSPSKVWPRWKTSGKYTSAPRHMKRGGITPITVRTLLFSRSLRPRTPGSPPNCRCQNLNPNNVTGSAPGEASAAVIALARPGHVGPRRRDHAGEYRVPLGDVQELVNGVVAPIAAALAAYLDGYQPPWVLVWKRIDNHGVHHAVHRGAAADP